MNDKMANVKFKVNVSKENICRKTIFSPQSFWMFSLESCSDIGCKHCCSLDVVKHDNLILTPSMGLCRTLARNSHPVSGRKKGWERLRSSTVILSVQSSMWTLVYGSPTRPVSRRGGRRRSRLNRQTDRDEFYISYTDVIVPFITIIKGSF